MRRFLLAGSSLLAFFASAATATATSVTYINGSPALNTQVATGFVQGDVLVNPNGLFNGLLQNEEISSLAMAPTPIRLRRGSSGPPVTTIAAPGRMASALIAATQNSLAPA
jgi:hypothetical protein